MLLEFIPAQKITAPKVNTRTIKRARLVNCFKDVRGARLALVSAPAGYGKTTLLATWAEECRHPFAWLSLDQDDNNPWVFWQMLIAAIQNALIRADTIESVLDFGFAAINLIENNWTASKNFNQANAIIAGLINEIDQLALEDLWLIIDDYHLIKNQSIHQAITYLLKYLPPNFHLAIGTRSQPPIGLDRMRACDQVIDIQLETLRFSIDEVGLYLRNNLTSDVSDAEVEQITKLTGGWISPIQFVVKAIKAQPNPTQYIDYLSGEYEVVENFIFSEIFQHQSSDLQMFLFQTSILSNLSGSICDVVTGRNDSHFILQDLKLSNIPIETLDKAKDLFHYQVLFAEALQKRFRNEYPEKYLAAHCRVGHWFLDRFNQTLDRDDLHSGLKHVIAGNDFQWVSDWLELNALRLVNHGFEENLVRWVSELQTKFILTSPILSAYHLYGLMASGNIYQTQEHLSETLKNSPAYLSSQGKIKALNAHVVAHDRNLNQSIHSAKTAVQSLSDGDPFWKAISMLALAGATMMTGKFYLADRIYKQIIRLSRQQNIPYLINVTHLKSLECLFVRGQMNFICAIYDDFQSQDFPAKLSSRLFGGILDSKYAQALGEFNQLDRALTHAHLGIEKCEQVDNNYVLPISWLSLIRVLYSRKDKLELDNAIEKLERITLRAEWHPWVKNRIRAWKIRSLISQNRITKARALLNHWEITLSNNLRFIDEEINLVHARLLIREKQFQPAIHLLNMLKNDAAHGGRIRKVIQSLNIIACAYAQQEKTSAALSNLELSLKIAEPFDFLRIFLDEGELMMNLLNLATQANIHTDYAQHILKSNSDCRSTNPLGQNILINPLSKREREILTQLENRMTNDEIASSMVISNSTVRTHLRSIFRKLDVHRRWDAVEKAKVLEII